MISIVATTNVKMCVDYYTQVEGHQSYRTLYQTGILVCFKHPRRPDKSKPPLLSSVVDSTDTRVP